MEVTLDESTLVLRPPGAVMHESSTCRMEDDPATSATNRHGQIHGVQGLYVADNSVLPTLTAAGGKNDRTVEYGRKEKAILFYYYNSRGV